MRRSWFFRGLTMVVFVAAFLTAFGFIVMTLWNAILPAIAGVHSITFVQALGLLVLSRILFGGLRGRGHRGWRWRGRMQARWQQMTPEEREQVRSRMGSRSCWRGDHSARASQAP